MTLTTEKLRALRDALKSWQDSYDPADDKEQYEMFVTAETAVGELLANREAQPVVWVMSDDLMDEKIISTPAYPNRSEAEERTIGELIPLYTAPPAPAFPERLPCPVHLLPGLKFGKGVPTHSMLDALVRRAEYESEREAMTPEQKVEDDARIEAFKALLPRPPAPAVPGIDELRLTFERSERESDDGFNLHKYGIGYADEATQARWESWLACRAAMLAAAPEGGNG
ncbi:hypothetical protein [Serratia marcescens]|uniref:hypothetical protein n=1 Tax=Serratia marcescens TaxID=615 RepID=UPI00148E2BA6|nr:hypothetical protein [Serratia marcescens]QJU41348.1 hypothetical protein HMI62_19390 [Serratia marcescens]